MFAHLAIKKVILHEVFRRVDQNKIPPAYSDDLEDLSDEALEALRDRIIHAMTSSTRCVQMAVAMSGPESIITLAANLVDADAELFIDISKNVANKLASEQKGRNIPGGVLVVFSGTVGVPTKRMIGVIKAEVHNGFMREKLEDDEKPKLRFLKSLMLTAQTKLYKVGIFLETDPTAENFLNGWTPYIYDETLTVANRYGAAKYFYEGFLGLMFPESSARQTRQFHDLTKNFINSIDRPEEEKIVLHNALITYLRADQLPTVGVISFGETYFGEVEIRDAYRNFMIEKGFPESAVNKDLSDVGTALKFRRLNFANKVKVSGPAETFDKLVTIDIVPGTPDKTTGLVPQWTQLIIKDKIASQE
jgi:hypothetical protein